MSKNNVEEKTNTIEEKLNTNDNENNDESASGDPHISVVCNDEDDENMNNEDEINFCLED